MSMDSAQAQRVIESLRKGIPPDGFVRHFTVGRASEIMRLTERLDTATPGALLIKANYGSGKTHLLRFIRESALEKGFAVSSVTLDSKGAVRFNRMDHIFGAICRNIEIPGMPGQKGIGAFFNFVVEQLKRAKYAQSTTFWWKLTNNWRWDFSAALDSPAMFVAVRAWITGESSVQNLVEDWLLNPWVYRSQRRLLYRELVGSLWRFFRDLRPEWFFHSAEVFCFHTRSYAQSWSALRDLQRLLCESGLKGLVILFDEFEDVITNLRNIAYQKEAFLNLFKFSEGKLYPGLSFFAVTPEFVEKSMQLLLDRAIPGMSYLTHEQIKGLLSLIGDKQEWGYYNTRFKTIPTFQMTPLDVKELEELAMRILETHGIAYDWEPDLVMRASDLDSIVRKAASVQIQDRARHTIITVVKALDCLLEEKE